MYLICRPLYGLGYSWWSGDGVLVGAWCTATKGSGVVWGWGEILIKTYPGTNPCRLLPPHPFAPSPTPRHPPSCCPLRLPCLLPRASRAQPVALIREYLSTDISLVANYVVRARARDLEPRVSRRNNFAATCNGPVERRRFLGTLIWDSRRPGLRRGGRKHAWESSPGENVNILLSNIIM